MSKGVLIFAFNNTKLDYFKQANWVADRVERFLGLSTTIVTDEASVSKSSHNIVIKEAYIASKKDNVQWYNANRFQSLDVTPYDETIVIDSDYIVNSDQLNLLFESPHDFLCHRTAYDVADKGSVDAFRTFGSTKMPHYWATVLFFRKTDEASMIFDLIEMIKENYNFYGKLYKFPAAPFRNDHAVSIALSIVYGHRINAIPTIPWSLPTAMSDIDVKQIDNETFLLEYNKYSRNKERPMRAEIKGHDLHCLNKVALEHMIDGN